MKVLSDKDRLYAIQRKNRVQSAKIAKLEAMLDYVSMMSDIPLPETETTAQHEVRNDQPTL